MRPNLIGVAGLSGSGKSELARQLLLRLDHQCEVVSLDSYYHDQASVPFAERVATNYDDPSALDWTLLVTHLRALQKGESIEEPQYLFAKHTRSKATRQVQPKSFVILEGILTLHREEIRRLLTLKVFVVTPPEECLRRRLERDIAERGRTRECVLEQYKRTVWPMAVEFVLPTQRLADLSVSGEQPVEEALNRVLHELNRAQAAAAGTL